MEPPYVMRRWSSRIRTGDEAAFTDYLGPVLADYASIVGNLDAAFLLRELGDGTSEFSLLSWWTSMDAIVGFLDSDFEHSRYFASDARFLLDKPVAAEHHRVVASIELRVGSSRHAKLPGQNSINY